MSDEVSQFLEQVERLRGQQIEEDEVRARELEEYLAAKRERQARREERARSISPQKSSPANTPSPRSSRRSVHLTEALRLDSPGPSRDDSASQSAEPEAKPEAPMDFNSSPTKENEAPLDVDTKSATTPPTRSSGLSWQRRPSSRSGSIRPLSMLATQNATQRSLIGSQDPSTSPSSATEQTFSKDQIAQSLGSKDPSWFRQTADRGANSAAYRRNQVEDTDRLDMASVKAQLPGMSAEQPKPSLPAEEPATPTKMRLASPPTLNPPGFDLGGDDKSLGDRLSNASPGRTSPTRANSRSNSPTKGMGGFVQSAMMKRSDSVKRWSVTSPPGLARANSIQSSQSGGLPARPQSMAPPGSTTPSSSRPTSRHGESDNEATPKAAPTIDTALEEASIPSSPSKTMDPRRWSPTKSSWLESALNKPPESPKSHHKSTSSQPAWMAELNKNKETTRPRPGSISHKHQVSIGGLMRSTPMGTATKTNTTGLGGIYSPPPGGNRPFNHGASFSISKSAPKLEPGTPAEEKAAQPEPEPVSEPEQDVPDPELTEEEKKVQEPAKEEPVVSPTEVKPAAPLPKPKPETLPKNDFRSSLRHRPTGSEAPKTEEPEFKNVFGTLRRTKTQNYVAPDELKDNILKGKASLNQTGGPKKTERVDEFKEAILKKKDDFKKAQSEGKGISRSNTPTNDSPLPEGLARRAEMAKRKSVAELKPTTAPSKPDSPKPTPGPKRIPSQTPSSPKPAPEPAREPADEGLKRVVTESNARPEEPRAIPSLHKETSSPARLQGRVGGKLAGRFNPALAGMLARGPPPMAANGGKASEESDSKGASASATVTEPSAPGPQLTHMTKGRARGPRRKAPTKAAPSTVSATPAAEPKPVKEKPKPATPKPIRPVQEKPVEEIPSPVEKGQESTPAPFSIQQQVAAKAALRGKPTPTKPTPTKPSSPKPAPTESTPTKTQEREPRRFQTREERTPSFPPKEPSKTQFTSNDYPSPLRIQKTGDAVSQPSSPKKLDNNRMSRFADRSSNGTTPEPAKEPARLTHQRTGSRSPVKMYQRPLPEPEPSSPTKVDSDPVVSVKNARTMLGGAAQPPPLAAKPSWDRPEPAAVRTPPRASRPLPEPVRSSPLQINKTPSRVATRPLPTPPPKEPQTPKASQPPSAAAPTKTSQGNDVAGLLSDFFGPNPSRAAYKVDAAELLMNRPPSGPVKLQSLSFQVFQISPEGRKSPVAAHYERTLFEREMYIAPHSFTNEAGWKRLEIYFWVGDQVPESAADDALLFVQKEAKALGGKLVKMQQGKETTEFLQALGGVVLIRRGSSNKYDSLAPNMLCGRRYQGQVAFDECDFTPSSLCAGFVYIITSQGKAYIWKGRGCDVTELSAAKLVGIELTLTGELIEADDGDESESFWRLFEGGSKPHSADHWRLKPNYAKYCSRLFCSDADTRQQVSEITPFNQYDLSPEHIYVLDAFFEMYIIVGARAQSRYASFRNALDFAQEYAILAAGMEDRPFVPISTVVLEGIPRDLKRVFRFWRDDLSPTATHNNTSAASGTPRRGRSLRVVSLTQALQALKE
ncbi:hypothetical protein NW762_002864 [Fusarium torreyae]|uniref:DUF4045 domain-containing protein n=1 Tax=Fusarium torreyae TaxID=1237075 RepID=A0A9W8SC55_9HYPO|nr:hypothetical protein NW762_002864 [Fusarium torreyae]